MDTAVKVAQRTSPNSWKVEFESGLTVLVFRVLATTTLSTMRPVATHSAEMPALSDGAKAGLQRAAIDAVLADLAPICADRFEEDFCGNTYTRLSVRLADL